MRYAENSCLYVYYVKYVHISMVCDSNCDIFGAVLRLVGFEVR